jgi:hypothetical protein
MAIGREVEHLIGNKDGTIRPAQHLRVRSAPTQGLGRVAARPPRVWDWARPLPFLVPTPVARRDEQAADHLPVVARLKLG